MMKIETNTHAENLNKNLKHYAYIGAYKLKIKEKGVKKRLLKLLLSLIFRQWLMLMVLVIVPLLIIGLHRSSYELSDVAR
jgi:hypothetical protein